MALILTQTPTETSRPTFILFAPAPRTKTTPDQKRVQLVPIERAIQFATEHKGWRMKEIRYHDGAAQKTWDWSDRTQLSWIMEHQTSNTGDQ